MSTSPTSTLNIALLPHVSSIATPVYPPKRLKFSLRWAQTVVDRSRQLMNGKWNIEGTVYRYCTLSVLCADWEATGLSTTKTYMKHPNSKPYTQLQIRNDWLIISNITCDS